MATEIRRVAIRRVSAAEPALKKANTINIRGVDFNIISMIGWIIEPPLLTALALMIEGKSKGEIIEAIKTVALFTPLNVIGGGFWYMVGTKQLSKFMEGGISAGQLRE